jgi:hypothetical protein
VRLFCNQSPQLPDKQLDIQGSGLGRLCPQDSIGHSAAGSSPGDESEVLALCGVVSLTSSAAGPFQDHLGVGERQVFGGRKDLDGAGGDPAVALLGGRAGGGDVAPGQSVDGVEQGPPVSPSGRMNSPPCSRVKFGVAFTYAGRRP